MLPRKVKPIKINIKEPTPTAAERLHARQQEIRKAAGLPDPEHYKKLAAQKQKEINAMKNEEVEQLDELRKSTLLRYSTKANKSSLNLGIKSTRAREEGDVDTANKLANKTEKRYAGIKKAIHRLTKEEIEQLDEMPESSMKTKDVHAHLKKSGWSLARTTGGHDIYKHPKASGHISVPRHKQLKAPLIRGIMKASKVNEDVEQLDEISADLAGQYFQKATQQQIKKGGIRGALKDTTSKRAKGKERALDRILKKEDVELDEQLYKKARFVSGAPKKPFKAPTIVSAIKEDIKNLQEKNVPTSPEKWARAKAQAKAKFDVYPSAYANGWAAKKYKEMGGGWKSVNEETEKPLSRKAQIVKDIVKGKKAKQDAQDEASDKFQKDPELSSDIHKT